MHAVNNFQNITEELTRKQENMDHNEELARMKEELNTELTMHDSKMTNARYRMRLVVPILCVLQYTEGLYLFQKHLLVI